MDEDLKSYSLSKPVGPKQPFRPNKLAKDPKDPGGISNFISIQCILCQIK
jgi:hypothetical protein